MSDRPVVLAEAARPLWRKIWEFPLVALLVAIGVVAACIAGVGAAFSALPAFENDNLNLVVRGFAGVIVTFIAYKLIIRRLGERRHDDLPLRGALGDTALGFGVGFAIFTTVVGIATLAGVYRITGWGSWTDFIEIVMNAGVVAGFMEELLMRGILFRWMEEFAGSWVALAISSLVFGLLHMGNPNATLFSSLAIAVEAGILLGGAYMLTRSLWLAIGIHAGWNVTQGFIYDVPVSGNAWQGMVEARLAGPELLTGGAFGLEASVIALVVATGAGAWMVLRARREGNVMQPWWTRRRIARVEQAEIEE